MRKRKKRNKDDMRGGMRSDMRGGMRSDMHGDMCGGMRGDVCGGVRDDMRGDMCGGVRDDMRDKRRLAMQRRLAFVFALVLTLFLAACSSQASFTQLLGDAWIDLDGLDGSAEGDFELPYTNVGFTVELTSGTVDVEIIDVEFIGVDDDRDVVPLDVIYEAKGLASGDSKSFTDDDGGIRVRVTSSDKATGKITFTDEG